MFMSTDVKEEWNDKRWEGAALLMEGTGATRAGGGS